MNLPSNYVSIAEVLALEQNRDGLRKEIKPMSFVNVIGVITDRREPCPTRSTGTSPLGSQYLLLILLHRLEGDRPFD